MAFFERELINLKPINLKPINLEPINLEPINLKPVNLKPVNLGKKFKTIFLIPAVYHLYKVKQALQLEWVKY
jgi:hypothetical protein